MNSMSICDHCRPNLIPGLLAALIVLPCACQSRQSHPVPLPVTEIADGVFVHQGSIALNSAENMAGIANIGFIVGTESVAVIDAGGSRPVAERLLAAVRKRTRLPVAWLILTHAHPDHVLGASVFTRAGAQLIGHHRLASALAHRFEGDLLALHETVGPDAAKDITPVIPDLQVRSTTRIDLGGRGLVIEAYPTAHTDHDVSVFDTATGVLWLSDLLFVEHIPSLEGSILGWIDVIESLRQRRDVTAVIPGHGTPSDQWPSVSDAQLFYLRDLVRQTRQALKDGMDMAEASQKVGRNHAQAWKLFENFHPRNAIVAYAELEWE